MSSAVAPDLEALRSWVERAIEAHVERRDRVRVEVLQPAASLVLSIVHVAVELWAGREGIGAVLDLAEPP